MNTFTDKPKLIQFIVSRSALKKCWKKFFSPKGIDIKHKLHLQGEKNEEYGKVLVGG